MLNVTTIREHLGRITMYLPVLFVAAGLLVGCSQTEEVAQDVGEATEDAADATVPGVGETELNATLTGGAEVPGPGDPDGTGEADVTFDMEDAEVCWDIDVSNVETITAAHIHRGTAGESGPPVVPLDVTSDGLDGCTTGVQMGVLQEILDDPSDFYVNVHNEDYPGGALRGQLVE